MTDTLTPPILARGVDLRERTKAFALRTISLCRAIAVSPVGGVIGRQLLRSSSSVGANYRAACRARSRREFVAKLGLVVEEADESLYWLELLRTTDLGDVNELESLEHEGEELLRILVASIGTAKRNGRRRTKPD